jgi:hypothetical protein
VGWFKTRNCVQHRHPKTFSWNLHLNI